MRREARMLQVATPQHATQHGTIPIMNGPGNSLLAVTRL
jgi:hypothetical protein